MCDPLSKIRKSTITTILVFSNHVKFSMPGTDLKRVWFYKHRKGVLGPVNSDELRFLAIQQKVQPETLVRADGSDEWIEYSQSPVPVVTQAKISPGNAMVVDSPVASDVVSPRPIEAQPTADSSSVPPQVDVAADEKRLAIVSVVAVFALILPAASLSSLWRQDSADGQVAGKGSSRHDGATGDDLNTSAGGTSLEHSGAGDSPVDLSVESSTAQKSDDKAAASQLSPETSPVDANPGDKSQNDERAMAANDVAMAEEDDAADIVPGHESALGLNPDRFGVALVPKVEAKPREKSAKPKASRAALQQSNLSARSGEGRKRAVEDSGGTVDSEKAVARALEWLRRIQRSDGSWDFEDVGEDAQPGSLSSPLGATAMATLCFLGSGSTTRTGPDKELVKRAFDFMISQEGAEVQGTDSMYVHALVTLCLTELVTMEPDEKIFLKHAVNAVRYIERAQDPVGGGWRYTFQSPGDTSVTGWDVMALQSGQSGKIEIDPAVVNRAQGFLDSVSDSGGATYAYTPGSPTTASMTAVGLLCRMYLGWPRDSGPLQQGIHRLSTIGVSRADMYYNYYATIALHHCGGTEWENWNATMRDQLVMTQLTGGKAAGSWQVTDPHGGSGGQIYQTCLSVLTLEVYYRYLPLYR